MDPERYYAAATYDAFVAAAQKYVELWSIVGQRATVPAGVLALLEQITKPLHLAVITEDWCIDAIGSVPYVAKLAELLPEIDVRIFGREANPDLMNAHLSGTGSRSIPVVIVYDDAWRELAWWGSRPAALQEWVMSVGATLPSAEKYHYVRQWYARDRGVTTLTELAEILRSATGLPATATTG